MLDSVEANKGSFMKTRYTTMWCQKYMETPGVQILPNKLDNIIIMKEMEFYKLREK